MGCLVPVALVKKKREVDKMLVKNWRALTVLVVLIWSVVNLFQVVPDARYKELKRLASLSSTELQVDIAERLHRLPNYENWDTFKKEEAMKSAMEEVSFANNVQSVGQIGDYHILTNLKLGLDLRGGSQLLLQAQPTKQVPEITPDVMKGVETVINNRVNSLGVSETVVQRTGKDRLIVELPGVKDPQEAKDRIGTTALLEFKEMGYDELGQPLRTADGSIVWKDVNLTGADFKRAQALQMAGGQVWRISFEFKPEGARKFSELTSRLVGRQIGIFLDGFPTERGADGRALSLAEYRGINVHEPIRGGTGEITGNFSKSQAIDLSLKLNAGSLPTKVVILEERTVGATLGQDSIEKSLIAGAVGISFVMVFMLLVYGVPGLVADVALILYTITTLAVFKVIPVTLTLAGIAGFILSVGMAVDANILIFERTKEELKAGKNIYSAVEIGFSRAFSSIFDSNMNSLIACSVLMFFGTSIVKGFAVTLAIGVLVSMFTAITASKVMLHLVPRKFMMLGLAKVSASEKNRENAAIVK